MTNKKSFNGWTNHITWLVNLHITNDYEIYSQLSSLKMDIDQLKNWVSLYISEKAQSITPYSPLVDDLLRYSIVDVNWEEIHDAIYSLD